MLRKGRPRVAPSAGIVGFTGTPLHLNSGTAGGALYMAYVLEWQAVRANKKKAVRAGSAWAMRGKGQGVEAAARSSGG